MKQSLKTALAALMSIVVALTVMFVLDLPRFDAKAEVTTSWTVPEGYNAHDYTKCVKFLEQTNENGVKNGYKLSWCYDPNNPATWGTDSHGDYYFQWTNLGGERRIQNVHFLVLYDRGLVGCLDVSGCTALTELNCELNNLTELNVSGCTALTELCCRANNLIELDVTGCMALTELVCDENNLTELDVSNNTALTWLDCSDNNLRALDVSNNIAFALLYCYGNNFTALDVSNNTALTSLDCSYNNLTELDVSKNTALTSLVCSNNNLTELDVSNNTALAWLDCSLNNLTKLDVSNNTALTYLNCYKNHLALFDISNNTALQELWCPVNNLIELVLSNNPELPCDCIRALGNGSIGYHYVNYLGVAIYAHPQSGANFEGFYDESGVLISAGEWSDYYEAYIYEFASTHKYSTIIARFSGNTTFQHIVKSDPKENRDFAFNENEEVEDLVFSKKSTEYNPRLAHFLSCMARAAYDKELIKDNYKVLGFSDPIQRHYDGGDPFAGFTIGKKQLEDESLMVLITIRGTDGWSEWLETNFHITTIDPPKGWHDGFAASADKVYQYLKSYLGGNILTNDVTYVICGHSLGGAVGNLLSVRLYNYGVPNTDVYDYNFACPNVAIGPESISEWNNNGCHNNIINIGNWCDIVTHLPGVSLEPSFTGYKWKKYGVSYWFNNGWQFLLSHDMAVYLDYLEKELDETYFTESEFVVQTIIGYCPVDITVYDSEGNPIAGTENNIPKYYGYEVGEKAVIYVQDDKKAIQIIGEEKCEVHIQATDDGEMDYIYCRQELVSGNTLISKQFGSVKLAAGKEMVSYVGGEMNADDIKLFIEDGNVITHEILEDGTEIVLNQADDEQHPEPSSTPEEESAAPAETPENNNTDGSERKQNKSLLIVLISVPVILLLGVVTFAATKKKK